MEAQPLQFWSSDEEDIDLAALLADRVGAEPGARTDADLMDYLRSPGNEGESA